MPVLTKTRAAKNDLIAHYVYLAEEASINTADRFLTNTENSFNILSQQPMIGTPLNLGNPKLASIRKWRVKEFDNFLIFYQPQMNGITIVRVLHAAMDWWNLLEI